jgi:hypothetical protein
VCIEIIEVVQTDVIGVQEWSGLVGSFNGNYLANYQYQSSDFIEVRTHNQQSLAC